MTVATVLQHAVHSLEGVSTTPLLDAQILLAHIVEKDKTWLLTYPDFELSVEQLSIFESLIAERKKAIPIPYIIGMQEFFGRSFTVTPDVLVPRQETEQLVDAVTEWHANQQNQSPTILDIGTGSGCIAITLQQEIPTSTVHASDISESALHIAKNNALDLSANITFHRGSLFDALPKKLQHSFDCIVSNPPYLEDWHLSSTATESLALRHEPRFANIPKGHEQQGDILVKQIIDEATTWLKPMNSLLIIEIGEYHAKDILAYAKEMYPKAHAQLHKDYATLDRFIQIEF